MNSISSFSVHPTIRVGIIGTGDTACTYYTSLQSLKDVGSIVFFAEAPSEIDNTDSAADSYTISNSSINTFLHAVDAVCFCAPLSENLPLALATADAGVPFLIDISMCSSTVDLAELALRVAPSTTAGIGNAERFNPALCAAAERLHDLRYVSIERSLPDASEAGISATSALIAPYLDVLLPHLPNGVTSVCAIGGAWVMYVLLRSGDVPVYFTVNSMASGPKATMYVEEASETLDCDFLKGTVEVGSRFSFAKGEVLTFSADDSIAQMLTEFLRYSSEGRAFGLGFAEAERVFAVCERIEADAKAGRNGAPGKARA